jgi:DNA-binding transcriptional LysR family regulator
MSNWDGIEEFVAVAKGGSFTKGAEMLGASLTHVSRAVMALEKRLQVQLLHRTTRVVKLTDTGRTFLEHCLRLIEERDNAFASVADTSSPVGHIRLTCSIALGERYVVPMVRQFAIDFPALSVSIALTNRIVDLVAEGFDIAIRTGDLPASQLIATRIASRRLILCASPAYLLAHGEPRSIGDLDGHECLIGTNTLWTFSNVGQEQAYRPKGRWRCNSGQSIVEAALSGMGICQLPDFYVHNLIEQGALKALLPELAPPDEPIWAVYPPRRHILPKISMLVERLKKELPRQLKQ